MRLKAEMERKDVLYEEALAKEKSRHMIEEKTLKESLQEQEMQVIASKREITQLKDKIGRVHSNKVEEHEEIMNDMKLKFEREKGLLQEENRRLTSDVEKVRYQNRKSGHVWGF